MPLSGKMATFKSDTKARLQQILGGQKTPRPEPEHPKMAMNMHVALPLYIYPSTGAWQPLFDALRDNSGVTFDVIVNPNNGPGGSVPDSNYISGISTINTYSNARVLGYVHTSYGKRALPNISSDIDDYQSWSEYKDSNITISGIFVDETPTSLDHLNYMTLIQKKVKSTLTHGNLVWTNPGVPVDSSFYGIADMINAYENTYDNWAQNGGNASIPIAVRNRSTVMLHSYPSCANTMASDVDALVEGGYAGALLIVDDQYSSFDSMWPTFSAEVSSSNANVICE
jgi:hypothetical protein